MAHRPHWHEAGDTFKAGRTCLDGSARPEGVKQDGYTYPLYLLRSKGAKTMRSSQEPKTQSPQEIVSFYHFMSFPVEKLELLQQEMANKAKAQNITGLVLLSQEGINATLSGSPEQLKPYLQFVEKLIGIDQFFYKRSPVFQPAFKRMKIKIKPEIINFGQKTADFGFHNLEPEDWEAMLKEKALTILDIRNDYEVEIGQFKHAKTMDLKEFGAFPQKLKTLNLPKEQKTLIYCTGGIRCEKAIVEMKNQGFKELYQLKGGIIHYLKQFPNKSFKGECFVFDRRVAVDQNLNPSQKYATCPHCGQAGGEERECVRCGKKTKICPKCLSQGQRYLQTCSKNCAHHLKIKPQIEKPAKLNSPST